MTRFLIAGAGIAGLTLVRALRGLGHSIDMVERSPIFDPAGVGIVLHPNGMEVLEYLGLSDEISAAGNTITRMELTRGESTLTLPLTEVWEGTGRSTTAILRPELHRLLWRSAFLPEESGLRLQMGCSVIGVECPESQPVAHFQDGSHRTYDLIVGADGVHSTVRQSLFSNSAAISTNLLYFRFPAHNVIGLPTDVWRTVERPGASYGFIPVGRDRVHCFVQLRTESSPCAPGEEESYFRTTFGPWDPALAQTLAARCGRIHVGFAYMVRPVIWGRGACVLLGDSAHAVSPTLSEGGSLAMEDAIILSLALRQSSSITEAITLYRSLRRERIAWAHRMSMAQINSYRLTRAQSQVSSAIATQHMRSMYEPLRRSLVPESILPILSSVELDRRKPLARSINEGATPNG